MNVDCILLHLYGLIGAHFDAMMRVGRDGMPETVFGLGQILPHELLRHMAIIAGGGGVVTGFFPAVEMVAHDVTVDACLGIVAQIGHAFGVIGCVAAETSENAG